MLYQYGLKSNWYLIFTGTSLAVHKRVTEKKLSPSETSDIAEYHTCIEPIKYQQIDMKYNKIYYLLLYYILSPFCIHQFQ